MVYTGPILDSEVSMCATDVIATIAAELDLAQGPVAATVALFDEGNTIPVVAR